MSYPDKIYPINFAGFFDLKDEPYYEGKSLLNIEDYPAAKEFADEICRRWNCHSDLLEALQLAKKEIKACYQLLDIDNKDRGYGQGGVLSKADAAIEKAKGL